MILYFSATGNDKYVAQELSKATGERMVALRNLVRSHKRELVVVDGEDFGVVMPTYWEGLPTILIDYLDHADIRLKGDGHYCYFVATYGADTGNIGSAARRAFSVKGIRFDSLYAARFVDNWTPYFDLTDPARNHAAEENGRNETAQIVQAVLSHEEGHDLPDQMSADEYRESRENYDRCRQTKLFELDELRCIGCGTCARQCPLQAIEMRDGHPAWVKASCTLCLGCYHRCPVGAIDYQGSLAHGQYVYPGVRLDD